MELRGGMTCHVPMANSKLGLGIWEDVHVSEITEAVFFLFLTLLYVVCNIKLPLVKVQEAKCVRVEVTPPCMSLFLTKYIVLEHLQVIRWTALVQNLCVPGRS